MTNLMRPKININGSSRKELVDFRIAAVRTIQQLMIDLQHTKPHGRDYMGDSERFAADNAIYRDRFALLDKLRNEIHDEALAIHRDDKDDA
jgi:hypothetical protein